MHRPAMQLHMQQNASYMSNELSFGPWPLTILVDTPLLNLTLMTILRQYGKRIMNMVNHLSLSIGHLPSFWTPPHDI
jgi:hypothetical protein